MNPKLKLHWSPRSPYVRKVMVCAYELGVTDRLELVRSVAAMLKPNADIMADNPLSKIPTLVRQDGSALFDSVVICEYLDDLAGGTLFPRQGELRWQSLRWHALGDGLLDNLILWRNERERAQPLAPLMDAFETKVTASIELLQRELPAISAAPFNIGTVAIGSALGYLDFRFDGWGWKQRTPQLAQWYEKLRERPSFQATEAREG